MRTRLNPSWPNLDPKQREAGETKNIVTRIAYFWFPLSTFALAYFFAVMVLARVHLLSSSLANTLLGGLLSKLPGVRI